MSDPAKPEPDRSARMLEWIKAIGMPLVTLLVTVLGGYYLTSLSKDREGRESSERLYAQLLTQREGSDAQIRKDMFSVVINRFMGGDGPKEKEDWNNKVLQLELLASNFSQSLDLAPLFKDLGRRLSATNGPPAERAAELRRRLDISASGLVFKQVNSLARRGFAKEEQKALANWAQSFGKPFIDETVPLSRLVPAGTATADAALRFRVEMVDVSIERREVEVRLRIDFPGQSETGVDRHFWVSQYDFPMLDNTQLPYGLRTSVVITEFFVPDGPEKDREANSVVKFHLIVFPASSASFKERQDYDDVLSDMLRAGRASPTR